MRTPPSCCIPLPRDSLRSTSSLILSRVIPPLRGPSPPPVCGPSSQLTAPRVPLPGELCELLAAMATEAAAAALAAATAGGGTGSTASAGGGENADADGASTTDHLDDIMYCQQLICLVLQVRGGVVGTG